MNLGEVPAVLMPDGVGFTPFGDYFIPVGEAFEPVGDAFIPAGVALFETFCRDCWLRRLALRSGGGTVNPLGVTYLMTVFGVASWFSRKLVFEVIFYIFYLIDFFSYAYWPSTSKVLGERCPYWPLNIWLNCFLNYFALLSSSIVAF